MSSGKGKAAAKEAEASPVPARRRRTRLAAFDAGVARSTSEGLALFDASAGVTGALALGFAPLAAVHFRHGWLLAGDGDKALTHASGELAKIARGAAVIDAFAVGRADDIAVARGNVVELWSGDGERRWATKGEGPFLELVVTRDHVTAVSEGGALVFLNLESGDPEGALRLASTEPTESWRLARVDGSVVVLALGDWLVWIDASTRKTVRRVRACAKVSAVEADDDLVVVAVEEGGVQSFRARTGEPRVSFVAHQDGVAAIALGATALFTTGEDGEMRAFERATLDTSERSASPVMSLHARGDVVTAVDRAGKLRVVEAQRDVAMVTTPEAPLFVRVSKGQVVVAATTRFILRLARPWDAPRPFALKAAPTAFSVDDAYAFAGTAAGAVDVYELDSGRHVTTYALSSDDRITALVKLPGSLLVVGTGALDGRVLVVDVAEAKVIHRVEPHEEAFGVTSLATDPRGRIVASGGDDGLVALIDPIKGKVLAGVRVKETPVSMAFDGTGRNLACAFADGTAAIVNLAQKGMSLSDLGLRGVKHVTFGSEFVFGFADGRVEVAANAAGRRPSDRPSA